jgi:cyclic pyranopterin phosphate synthase
MPHDGIALQPASAILSYERIAAVAQAAGGLGFRKIKLTGGEPLARRQIERLVGMIAATGHYTDIGMTTNGTLLTAARARVLRDAGLMRVNVSLDTLDADRFARITRGGRIDDAIRGIDSALAAGLTPVKINMVILPDTTAADIDDMRAFCRARGTELQTIARFSLNACDSGAVTNADRPPQCDECNRLRLTADGYLKSCLRSDREVPVDFEDIGGSIRAAVAGKGRAGVSCTTRAMAQIGG